MRADAAVSRRRAGDRQQAGASGFWNRREEVPGVIAAELRKVLLHAPDGRIAHARGGAIASIEECECTAQRAGLGVKGEVDQNVVVEVDLPVEVKVAVKPP
jgi:hypothetical protein